MILVRFCVGVLLFWCNTGCRCFFTGVFFGAIFVAVVLIGALCLMVRLNGYKKTPIKAFLVMQ